MKPFYVVTYTVKMGFSKPPDKKAIERHLIHAADSLLRPVAYDVSPVGDVETHQVISRAEGTEADRAKSVAAAMNFDDADPSKLVVR